MRIFTLIILSFWLSQSFGNEIDSNNTFHLSEEAIFDLANQSYKDEEFSKSLELYASILDKGMESAEIYFNMGNAYYKLNDLPHCILYYEKALKLNPDDEDILNNLEIANLKTVDKVEAKPELPIAIWWRQILNQNLIDEWAIQSIILSFSALIVMIFFLVSTGILRRIAFFSAIGLFSLSLVFFILGQQQKGNMMNEKYGIVFTPSVTVKSSPEEDGTRLFVIHEGTKIQVLKHEEEWSQISLMNGNKGWIKTESFKAI